MRKQGLFLVLAAVVAFSGFAFSGAAYADDAACNCAPAVPPADVADWAMRGLLGFAKTSGTSDTTALNGMIHIAHTVDQWKFLFGAQALYSSTDSVPSAQDLGAEFQANYNISDRLYWFGGLSYDNNKFSGYQYQEMLDTGVGYQFFKDADTKLSGQVGIGEQRLAPETIVPNPYYPPGPLELRTPLGSSSGVVATAAVNFEHSFNDSTKLLANGSIMTGSLNTMTTLGVGLQVKMSHRLSLVAAYQLINNSTVPVSTPPISKSSGLTTLNIAYELKNPDLAPQ
jgi:putative salt-induced outer membrane protein